MMPNRTLVVGDDNNDQIHHLLCEMADFIALYETIDEKLKARELALEEKLSMSEKLLAEQLANIRTSLLDFQAIMTESGAARWRVAADQALRDGSNHLKTLQDTSLEITQTIKEGCNQLEKVTNKTVNGLAKAANSFQSEGFKEVALQGCDKVRETTFGSIKRIARLIKSFYAKSIVTSLIITLFIIFMTGLYMNDEWPWEIHQTASKERSAGQTLLAAWSHLTPTEQQDILNASKKYS